MVSIAKKTGTQSVACLFYTICESFRNVKVEILILEVTNARHLERRLLHLSMKVIPAN